MENYQNDETFDNLTDKQQYAVMHRPHNPEFYGHKMYTFKSDDVDSPDYGEYENNTWYKIKLFANEPFDYRLPEETTPREEAKPNENLSNYEGWIEETRTKEIYIHKVKDDEIIGEEKETVCERWLVGCRFTQKAIEERAFPRPGSMPYSQWRGSTLRRCEQMLTFIQNHIDEQLSTKGDTIKIEVSNTLDNFPNGVRTETKVWEGEKTVTTPPKAIKYIPNRYLLALMSAAENLETYLNWLQQTKPEQPTRETIEKTIEKIVVSQSKIAKAVWHADLLTDHNAMPIAKWLISQLTVKKENGELSTANDLSTAINNVKSDKERRGYKRDVELEIKIIKALPPLE